MEAFRLRSAQARICSAEERARLRKGIRQSSARARFSFFEGTPDFAAKPPACIHSQIVAVGGGVPALAERMLSGSSINSLNSRLEVKLLLDRPPAVLG